MSDLRLLFICSLLMFSGSESSEVRTAPATDEERLHEELFTRRHYNRHCRPAQNANETVSVEMAIVPKQIAEFDNLKEVLRLLYWIKLHWIDFRFSWNESQYGGISSLVVPRVNLWNPDIVITNSAEPVTRWSDLNAIIHSNGSVYWFPPLITASYCPIDISWFPFDEQSCTLDFESWSYDSSKLNLTLKDPPIVTVVYRKNSEWDLTGTSATFDWHKYECCEHPFSSLKFAFHLRRRILFHAFNLILPFSLLSAVSVFAFVLPVNSGERIGLEISTLLALSVHQLLVADSVPPTSDVVPLMGIYFACVVIMNASSLISMVIVSNLYHRSMSTHPIPNWVKSVCRRLNSLLGIRNDCALNVGCKISESKCEDVLRSASEINSDKQGVVPDGDVTAAWSRVVRPLAEPEVDWQFVALVIDRLCFCICVVYITITTVAFYACAIIVRWN